MFSKLSKHRKFDYTPLYYKPEKDEQKKRIHFQRLRHRTKTRPIIWLLALLIFVIYMLIALSKVANNF